jgi:alkylation response protein AidB-like acyl-CoA dehydrogenase
MISFRLTEDQIQLQQTARKFAREEIRPIAAQYDRRPDPQDCIPMEVIRKGVELGFSTMTIPEEYGGQGCNTMDFAVVSEEIAWGDVGVAATVCGSARLGVSPLLFKGTEEQKRKWLGEVCSDETGTYLTAFAATEPGSGSDVGSEDPSAGVRTTAIRDGDSYVLNGTKVFCTNGGLARLYVVFAKTDPTKGASEGLSAFVVPSDLPGFSIGKIEDKIGFRLCQNAELIFENARVPKENLLGEEGDGIAIAMDSLCNDGFMAGVNALGLSVAAYEAARDYAKERIQGGQPILYHQAVGSMLVDMWITIETSRNLIWKCCWHHDEVGASVPLASAAKVFCSDAALQITSSAVEVLGGYGLMKDYPVEKYFRDVKILQIAGGTNQVHRLVNIMFL